MRVAPITCYRPTPQAAPSFASLPYDVFDEAQAAAYVAAHPQSFLAIDRAETNFGPGQDPYAPEVYAKAGELIRGKALDGTLVKDQTPCLYLYRLQQGDHSQRGLVAACSVDEYDDATIRRHELTHPDKLLDRVQHIRATGAQTGPVLLAYRDSLAVDVICDAACMSEPLYDFVDEQGVRQTVWRISRTAAIEALGVTFSTVPCAYIADGHHRAAAAAQVAHDLREEAEEGVGELPADSFLAVLFPASQLSVRAYNRVVHDTADLSVQELLDAVASAGFAVGAPQEEAVVPEAPRSFGLFVHGLWYPLAYQGELPQAGTDPAGALDVTVLQDRVLAPILGIDDPRTNTRISFVGGSATPDELERRAGDEGVAFVLYPTTVDDLMAVSDAGQLMPPKSTWFEPKLLSGLFIRRV